MIGHFLAQLTPEEEDRVLTTTMRPGDYYEAWDGINARWVGTCLVGVCHKHGSGEPFVLRLNTWSGPTRGVEARYDSLCVRFGTERVNRVIRDRILTNRLWRELRLVKVAVAC